MAGGKGISGNALVTTELYTPDGSCLFQPKQMPVTKQKFILYWTNKEIFTCGGENLKDCYVYFISNDTWQLFTSSNYSSYPYGIYDNKIYFSPYTDGYNAQVLDLTTKTWSSWPLPPVCKYDGCQVTWNDAFVRFGGSQSNCGQVVQIFNHTTKIWSTLGTTSYTTFDTTGCTLIPGDKVFLIGTSVIADQMKFTVYDLNAKKWIFNGTQSNSLLMPAVLMLGKRVFVIQGDAYSRNTVLEFHYSNNSFSIPKLSFLGTYRTRGPAAVAVPAKLFRNVAPLCTGVF